MNKNMGMSGDGGMWNADLSLSMSFRLFIVFAFPPETNITLNLWWTAQPYLCVPAVSQDFFSSCGKECLPHCTDVVLGT